MFGFDTQNPYAGRVKDKTRKLGSYGTRMAEVLERAAKLPMDPPNVGTEGDYHYEDDRWWQLIKNRWVPVEPSVEEKAQWKITEVAREYDTMEKLAGALTTALMSGLSRQLDETPSSPTFQVVSKINLGWNGYDVTLTPSTGAMNAMWNVQAIASIGKD